MSLIAIPLPATSADDSRIRDALTELATLVTLDTQAGGQAVRETAGREPLFVVPFDDSEYRDDAYHALVDNGVLLTRDCVDAETTRERGSGIASRLRNALIAALRHSAHVEYAASGEAIGIPLTVIVPIVCLSDERQNEAVFSSLKALTMTLDSVAESITAGSFSQVKLASSSFRVMPWVYSSQAGEIPDALFEGSPHIGAGRMLPIVYSAVASLGQRRSLAGYGQSRLTSDLIALHALSSDADTFRDCLGLPTRSSDDREYLLAHSSLYEYPFNDIIRESVLTRLSSSDARTRILPDAANPGEFARPMQDHVSASVRTGLSAIQKVVERRSVPEDAFSFRQADKANALGIRPQPLDFDIAPTHESFAQVSLARKADRLHTRFYQSLEKRADVGLERTMREALDESHGAIRTVTDELEAALHKELNFRDPEKDRGADRLSQTGQALGRVIATIDGVTEGLDELGRRIQDEKLERPEDILDEAMSKRDGWVDDEERLLNDGRHLPQRVAMLGEAIVVGVGGFLFFSMCFFLARRLFAVPDFFKYLLAILVGGGAAIYLYYRRALAVQSYFDQWNTHCESLRNEADKFATRLVKVVNHRIRYIKFTATADLKRSLVAARQRFLTEIAGFDKLVEDELSARRVRQTYIERAKRDQPDHVIGRFRVEVDRRTEVRIDERELHADLEDVLQPTLALSEMPKRVPIDEHLRIIKGLVDKVVAESSSIVEELRNRATTQLQQAVDYGTDQGQISAAGASTASAPRSFFLPGRLVEGRTNIRHATDRANVDVQPVSNIVSRNVPSELAVTLTVRRISMPRPGGADG